MYANSGTRGRPNTPFQQPAMDPAKEKEGVDTAMSVMGWNTPAERERALNALRKHGGDIDKMVDSLLNGNDADSDSEIPALIDDTTPISKEVIGLTGTLDDDEQAAIRLSLEPTQPEFGPSTREATNEWAMTTSNATMNTSAADDLARAIQASLEVEGGDFYAPWEAGRRRLEGCPIALRAPTTNLTFAALLLHALFFVPQIRHTMAEDRLNQSTSANNFYKQLERIFITMERSVLSEVDASPCFVDPAMLPPIPWDGPSQRVGYAALKYYDHLVVGLHYPAYKPSDDTSRLLFTLSHAPVANPKQIPFTLNHWDIGVPWNVPNDLMSRLTSTLEDFNGRQAIVNSPEVLVCHIQACTTPFVFPAMFYVDQFLMSKVALVEQKTAEQKKIQDEINAHLNTIKNLTNFEDTHAVDDLNSSIYYFENVADDKGDSIRREKLDKTIVKLRAILAKILTEVQELEAEIAKLRETGSKCMDVPELKESPYILRTVLIHAGGWGRKQLYSYVHDRAGKWWKVTDDGIIEVTEEIVLTDQTGVSIGAGPYMLIYSRQLPAFEEARLSSWDDTEMNYAMDDNARALEALDNDSFATTLIEDWAAANDDLHGLPIPFMKTSTPASSQNDGEPMDVQPASQ